MKFKRGVSEIVSYVLLVIVAVTMSVIVYSYLSVYVPKEKPECQEDVGLIVKNYSCSALGNQLNITLLNKGFFKIDASYIRISSSGKEVKDLVNNNSIYFIYEPGNAAFPPGKTISLSFNEKNSKIKEILKSSPRKYELEIEPAVISKKEIALCNKAIINQQIDCN